MSHLARSRLALACIGIGLALAHASSKAAPLVYVANTSSSSGLVSIVDAAAQALVGESIAVGLTPRAVAVHPDGTFAYVVSIFENGAFGHGAVSVIQTQSKQVVATIVVGDNATAAAISPSGGELYVLNQTSNSISVIDTSSNAVTASIGVGAGTDLVVDPNGERLFVATLGGIAVISTSERAVTANLPVSGIPQGIAVSPDGRYVYVTEYVSLTNGNVSVISTQTGAVTANIAMGPNVYGVVAGVDGARLYVSDGTSVAVIDTATNAVRTLVPVGHGARGMSLTPDGRHLYVMNSNDRSVSVLDTTTDAVVNTIAVPKGANSYGRFIGPTVGPVGTSQVLEFYNAQIDHYFVTMSESEIADLDRHVHPGWSRTGQRFFAYPAGTSAGTGHPVCRFYGLPSAGLDSHFYSASSAECSDVAQRFAQSWQKESDEVFRITLPALDGSCSPGTIPVFRLWNARADSNHRYTTNLGIRQQMLLRNYVSEGYGPLGVVMCSPL
jgi:YVTN family beta-propeller protein